MDDEIFPRHYEAWKNCITKKCKITLDREYLIERIKLLSDNNSSERNKFVEKYGNHWANTVLEYFKQALHEA